MKTVLIIFLLFISVKALSQTSISGKVSDANGKTIQGANVFLKDSYDGSSTDENGKFEFSTSMKGSAILIATFVGYKEFSKTIVIDDRDLEVEIILEEEINELQSVTITAGSFNASDVSRRTVFRALDIATTAGATADIAGALNTLPGTQKVGESGRLFVRGGDGSETRTFIDGLVVMDAYSPAAPNTPSRGRFLPFMFKGTSFSTGGYSAEYGQALSSALVLDSKDKAELTRTDFGILSVGGDVGHTQVWKRSSIGGKIQYTNLRPYVGLISQEIAWDDAPISFEGSAAFRQEVGKTGLLKIYGNINNSNFSLFHHDIDDYQQTQLYELTNNYLYINASYQDVLNADWTIRSGVSYTYLKNEAQTGSSINNELQNGLHVKSVFEGSLSDHMELKIGGEVIDRSYDQVQRDSGFPTSFDFREVVSAVFAEADLYATNRFVTRIGGRAEYNNLNEQLRIDPRISLAYKIGRDGQTSLAYGKFRQSAKNEFIKIDSHLESEKADHYVLNYQYVKGNKIFRIETFYKRYDGLIKYEDANGFQLSNNGSGDAKGIELFWRDNASFRRFDYWISYSFLDTRRNYLDFPYSATPSFASKHNFSIVTKYFIRQIKSQLGFTYSFTSGRPYNNPNTNTFHAFHTPNYADLSFNWSYLPTTSVIVYFSCTNLLGRDNIFGYEYSNNRGENGLFNGRPIRQAAPRFLFLGVFVTLSKDKSVNQLPNL